MSKGSVKRWSAKRKQDVVLRLLRCESLDALSRDTGQLASVLSGRRDTFLEGGVSALKRRTEDPKIAALERELKRHGYKTPAEVRAQYELAWGGSFNQCWLAPQQSYVTPESGASCPDTGGVGSATFVQSYVQEFEGSK